MPLRSDWSTEYCPIRRSLDVLGDPWVLLIVRDVLHGNGRFDQLHRNLGISEAVLSRRLRTMREAGLLATVDYERDGRVRQRYVATEAAADLLPLLHHLAIWGERHTVEPEGGAHMALVHQACGEETTDGERCSACGEQLRPEDMTWVKPWLGSEHQLRAAGA
ncbi:DNA-binding HxlR family transcriptional regulator [Nocardioides aromaticivorans]|uniref:HxlR family transcriptional regulator n=1 Tax=Nocardioides aromaticivorans TaxID=200618 RepID=A0A7Y9ZKC6_9ACTN|nr:helix-turn-helix domain-containing protein [Nocardioides aromaticivorans]NYI45071.1 DNA-binding HxlR family transcriptional regulator [Nocardioides aromaticivorans]QSR24177.1 HxlR family transcriptional regulator [Nocardioides aromaticivorans]